MKREDVLDITRGIIGMAFIVGMIVVMVMSARQCSSQYDKYQQNRPTYHVSYGNFFGRSGCNFETYKTEGNHYIFYDKNGAMVYDVTVSGNNRIDIYRNRR